MDSESPLCRVGVHAGTDVVDLTLPATLPLAVLLPRLCELVDRVRGAGHTRRARRLCTVVGAPLDPSKTLPQNGIDDGDIVVLTTTEPPPLPRLRRDPATELAQVATDTAWDTRAARWLSAVALLGATGWTVLPGGPGTPQLLLGASAAGGAAAVAARSVPTSILFPGLAAGAGLTAAAALGGTLMTYDLRRTGVLLCALAVAALVWAARLALTASASIVAVQRLSVLLCASGGAATLGITLATATGGPVESGLGAAVTAVLALRARAHHRPAQRLGLLLAGAGGAVMTIGSMARIQPDWGPWLFAILLLACSVAVMQRPVCSPLLGESLTALEYAGLAAVLPLAGWSLGVFDLLGPGR